jgi:hypothetical protein
MADQGFTRRAKDADGKIISGLKINKPIAADEDGSIEPVPRKDRLLEMKRWKINNAPVLSAGPEPFKVDKVGSIGGKGDSHLVGRDIKSERN